ncbi:MAG TPA: Clp protease N-terminal domain-containing protein [Terriglobales bacterium]|nr:Clp protease N-terminal domain-containing protein [Terriglobales bacterium]
MFERYTEKARRVIFFARYEASQFGSPYIETEHLLLGLLREDKATTRQFFSSAEAIRQEIEKATLIREQVPTSVDLPLSNESKRVLAYAAEEAERLNHHHIGTEHLFLGLMREQGSFAARLINERGVALDSARAKIQAALDTSAAASGAGAGWAGGGPGVLPRSRAETRVVMRRSIIFLNETDGTNLGETFSIDVPRVGEEVMLNQARATVTGVTYYYAPAEYVIEDREANLKPDKIEVLVRMAEK